MPEFGQLYENSPPQNWAPDRSAPDNGSISAILNPINIEPNLIYEKDVNSDRKISKYTN